MRIGIVGAGAAGLTAAEALRSRGVADITLLEKSQCAGGKCCSIEYEGCSYELGAGVLSGNNHVALEIAKKYGVATEQVDFSPSLFLDAVTGEPLAAPSFIERLKLAYQTLFRYRKLCKKYPRLATPGLDQIDAELAEPFSTWAVSHGIPLVAKEFASFFTGYGYGFFDEIPAAYVLKYYSWDLIRAFLKKQIYKFPGGIQGLWTRVAEEYDVRYNTTITRIERGEKVVVQTSQQDFEFDKLIIAAPLDNVLPTLDASEEEQTAISKIQYVDYRTYACILKNFPRKNGYIPGNAVSSRKGHPVFWYRRYPDSDFVTFYVIGDWHMPDEDVQRNIEHVVRQAGGQIEQLHTTAHWNYFPHVSPKDMRNGYFDKLEALQGQRHTFYAGELLNFSTVGHSTEYSKYLVERFFPFQDSEHSSYRQAHCGSGSAIGEDKANFAS